MRCTVVKKYVEQGHVANKVLFFSGLSSSTWYHFLKPKTPDRRKFNLGRQDSEFSLTTSGDLVANEEVKAILQRYRGQNIHFANGGGYKKLSRYLKRNEGIIVNQKKCYRLCKEAGVLLPCHRKRKIKRTISINRIITAPNSVWEFDIKYIYIQGEKRFAFLLVFIDVFSRKIMYYYLGLRCQSHNLVATLSLAIERHGLQNLCFVVRSDNGSQMTSKEFKSYLNTLEGRVLHEFIPCATPNKDAHVESFYSILEIEFIQVHYFENFRQLYMTLGEFIIFYNDLRLHGSLRYNTPSEIMNIYNAGGLIAGIKQVKI